MPTPGPLELVIILVIALIVLGPGRLPGVGAALGKSIREFRKASSDIQEATRIDTSPLPPAPPAAEAPAAPVASAPEPPVASAPEPPVASAPEPPVAAAPEAPAPSASAPATTADEGESAPPSA